MDCLQRSHVYIQNHITKVENDHNYSRDGEKFLEFLHEKEGNYVVVCCIGGSLSALMRGWNDDYSDISLDKEKERRQEYWKGRQLPPRLVSRTTVEPATEDGIQCNIATTTVSDDEVQLSVAKPTTTQTTEALGVASLETTRDNCTASNKGDPSPGSEPEYKSINDWADFWRYDIGVNVIPADTRRKVTYESWAEWQDKPIPDELYGEWKSSGAFNKGIAVILGKVWHNPVKKELYLIGIDLDNRKAIEEVAIKGLEDLS